MMMIYMVGVGVDDVMFYLLPF